MIDLAVVVMIGFFAGIIVGVPLGYGIAIIQRMRRREAMP